MRFPGQLVTRDKCKNAGHRVAERQKRWIAWSHARSYLRGRRNDPRCESATVTNRFERCHDRVIAPLNHGPILQPGYIRKLITGDPYFTCIQIPICGTFTFFPSDEPDANRKPEYGSSGKQKLLSSWKSSTWNIGYTMYNFCLTICNNWIIF